MLSGLSPGVTTTITTVTKCITQEKQQSLCFQTQNARAKQKSLCCQIQAKVTRRTRHQGLNVQYCVIVDRSVHTSDERMNSFKQYCTITLLLFHFDSKALCKPKPDCTTHLLLIFMTRSRCRCNQRTDLIGQGQSLACCAAQLLPGTPSAW